MCRRRASHQAETRLAIAMRLALLARSEQALDLRLGLGDLGLEIGDLFSDLRGELRAAQKRFQGLEGAADAAQRAILEDRDPRHDENTVWTDTPEGEQARKRQARASEERIKAAQWSGSRWEE